MKGHALVWWKQVQNDRIRKGKEKIATWEQMKEKLRCKFLPIDYRQTLFQKLHNFRQGSKTVQEYTEEFYNLQARNDLREDEEQRIARYLAGLRPQIQDELIFCNFQRIDAFYSHALKAESKLKRQTFR